MQRIALLSKVHFKPFGLLSHSSRSSAATLLTLIHFQQRLFLSQAACPGHRTWVTPEVETGLAEGHTRIKWQDPHLWMEEAYAAGLSFDDIMDVSWVPEGYPLSGSWYYRCRSTCVHRSANPLSECDVARHVCAGPPRHLAPHHGHVRRQPNTTAGSPAQQMLKLKEALSTHGFRHRDCPAASLNEEFVQHLPAHKSGNLTKLGSAHLHTLTLPQKDYGPSHNLPACPIWPVVFWSSVPEALALYVIKQLATRTGVRVMEVHKISWPNNLKEFARCNAYFYAPKLNPASANGIWFPFLQMDEIAKKKGTGPFIVALVVFNCNVKVDERTRMTAYKKFIVDKLHYGIRHSNPPVKLDSQLLDQEPVHVWRMSRDKHEIAHDFAAFFGEEHNHPNISHLIARANHSSSLKGMLKYGAAHNLTYYEALGEKMRIGYVWNGTVSEHPEPSCPQGAYYRETMFGRPVPEKSIHLPIVEGVFRWPRRKWVCSFQEAERCVRNRQKYGFMKRDGVKYGAWRKPYLDNYHHVRGVGGMRKKEVKSAIPALSAITSSMLSKKRDSVVETTRLQSLPLSAISSDDF